MPKSTATLWLSVRGLAKRAERAFLKAALCPSESATAPFDGSAVKSAFALLSQKVTKARCGAA